jgi:tetratricopeptide (TPR) repeat protein
MKRNAVVILCLFLFTLVPMALLAEDFMAQGNDLYEKGVSSLVCYKQSGDMFARALEANPSSYEAAWKASRGYREFANGSMKQNTPDWKDVCRVYGKLGMKYGEKAIALNQNGVEGNAWYAFSVGNYSDSVSVLTAMREGLKNKTQGSLERAYKADKLYFNGGPMKAYGRFWFLLPWPMQDKRLSLRYLRECQRYLPNDPENNVFLAETLTAMGQKDEARTVLQKAASSDSTYYWYFVDLAKQRLREM